MNDTNPDPTDPTRTPTEPQRYSPTPEPRTDWTRPEYGADRPTWPTASPTQTWSTPAPAPTAPAEPVTAGGRRGGGSVGTVLAASLIAGVLASGGTFLAINASGALDRPAPATTVPNATTTGSNQPVTIDESSAVIDVASKVGPAVVKITTQSGAGDEAGPIPQSGVGSGVLYDANGWILTNRHVVAGSDTLTIELADGHVLDGRVYGIDTLTDLAIVKVDQVGLPAAQLGDSDKLEVGQLTVAIGSPLGTYSNSVTSGILSATGRSIQVEGGSLNNLLQTDTAINPGNSGGPLLDAAGNVIGINTAIASSAEGIGFAIPINLAKPIMRQAVAGEDIARPYIGIRFRTIDVQLAETEELPVEDGALIQSAPSTGGEPAVVPGGPADDAGIESGDIVTSIEGIELDTEHPLDAVVSQFGPGETVSLEILRDGETRTIEVTLGTRPADL
jgi:S1-C subfamily serine protease